MPDELRITIPGIPVGWKSHLPGQWGGRYTDPVVKAYKQKVQVYAKQARRRAGLHEPIPGMVEMTVQWIFPPQCQLRKKQRELIEAGGLWPHVGRHDEDNLSGPLNDGLKGIAFRDDCWIVRAIHGKFMGKEPRTEVTIKAFDAEANAIRRAE